MIFFIDSLYNISPPDAKEMVEAFEALRITEMCLSGLQPHVG